MEGIIVFWVNCGPPGMSAETKVCDMVSLTSFPPGLSSKQKHTQYRAPSEEVLKHCGTADGLLAVTGTGGHMVHAGAQVVRVIETPKTDTRVQVFSPP